MTKEEHSRIDDDWSERECVFFGRFFFPPWLFGPWAFGGSMPPVPVGGKSVSRSGMYLIWKPPRGGGLGLTSGGRGHFVQGDPGLDGGDNFWLKSRRKFCGFLSYT